MGTKHGLDRYVRLEMHVVKGDGCWLWGGRSWTQHPRMKVSAPGEPRQHEQCHRVAYEQVHGPIPEYDSAGYKIVVRHSCDTYGCCRPEHLLLGTQADNVRDMDERGRRVAVGHPGAAHPGAKLTEDQVRDIRQERAAGVTLKVLSERHGVGMSQVSRIARGQSW
jgi:hypothetical protein